MGFLGVLLVRRAIADVAVDNDERGPVGAIEKGFERVMQKLQIIGVTHAGDVPAVAGKAHSDIFSEGEVGFAFNGDAVVVVNPAQVAEPKMPGERCRFSGNAFHHVAVAADGIYVVIEQLVARFIEVRRLPALRNRHAHGVADALTQWPGGGFHSGGPAIFGMSWTFAFELAKAPDVIEFDREFTQSFIIRVHRLHSREVQQGIKEHGGMAVRKDKTVAIGPNRIFRIKAQQALPQSVSHGREGHGRSGVPGIGLLYCIHGECANCIDAELIQTAVHYRPLHGRLQGH